MNLTKRLDAVRAELEQLDAELRVSLEQLSFLAEVADEAKTQMLVTEAPLEKRNFDEASGDLERHRRYHTDLERRIELLRKEQDDLLDQILKAGSG